LGLNLEHDEQPNRQRYNAAVSVRRIEVGLDAHTAAVAQFDRDGFLNGGRVLGDADVDELREELDRVIAANKRGFAAGEAKPVRISDTPQVRAARCGRSSTSGKRPPRSSDCFT
jgi:hypothetical protein